MFARSRVELGLLNVGMVETVDVYCFVLTDAGLGYIWVFTSRLNCIITSTTSHLPTTSFVRASSSCSLDQDKPWWPHTHIYNHGLYRSPIYTTYNGCSPHRPYRGPTCQ